MAMRIRQGECTNCRLCHELCPLAAVRPPRAANAHETYFIVPELCTECVGQFARPRCQAVCPASCIETDPLNLEDRAALVRKWHRLALGAAYEDAVPSGLEEVDLGESGA